MRIQGIIIGGVVVLFFAETVYSADRYVPTGTYPTIQSAINASSSGDRVILNNGLFSGSGNRDIDFLGKDITVQSKNPSDPCDVAATIINIEATSADPHRGFIFQNEESNNALLDGVTIRKGYAMHGGGIYCTNNSTPTIKRCIIHDNESNSAGGTGYGGGICCHTGANPTIEDCTIRSNVSIQNGGGIYCGTGSGAILNNCTIELNHTLSTSSGGGGFACTSADCELTLCTIQDNQSDYDGGGLYTNNSDLIIQQCTIEGNTAYRDGGGLSLNVDGDITVKQCTITGNSAENTFGGGIAIVLCSPDIQDCTINANTAGQSGGGIYSGTNNAGTIDHCTIIGNKAYTQGGGIYSYSSQVEIAFCTLTGNVAQSLRGGGFACFSSTPLIANSILWANSAPTGQELSVTNAAHPSTLIIFYCDVEGGLAGAYTETGCVINWPMGNIDEDPCFADPGYWDDNHTSADPSDDFWVEGDYHLKSYGWRWYQATQNWGYDMVTSRCIDAGNPGNSLGDELISVPPDPTNIYGENIRVNMGAYGGTDKASMPPYDWTLLGDLSNDGIINLTDQAGMKLNWLVTDAELPGDLTRNGTVDIDDLNLLIAGWLETTSWF